MDCKHIFNTKKTHVIYNSNSVFEVWHICHFDLLPLIYIDLRCGVGRKLFEELPKGRGRILSEVFVATEFCPDNILFLHFLT